MAGTAILTLVTKIEDIEKAIEQLSAAELAAFRAWFEEFDERVFDEKIERDAKSGKLDKLMAEARANHEAGRREEF
ncbi:MAG TPA: hypothetical protein VG758_10510 [Hyphomicrobiaceae bacterium]|jgi:hypothetical protein|nr:hypothetical protein [Hyphomicrobiaceae bacterium]